VFVKCVGQTATESKRIEMPSCTSLLDVKRQFEDLRGSPVIQSSFEDENGFTIEGELLKAPLSRFSNKCCLNVYLKMSTSDTMRQLSAAPKQLLDKVAETSASLRPRARL